MRYVSEPRTYQIRQTEGQAEDLRQLMAQENPSEWDQGRLRALAMTAPARQQQEALDKLAALSAKRKAGKRPATVKDLPSVLGDLV